MYDHSSCVCSTQSSSPHLPCLLPKNNPSTKLLPLLWLTAKTLPCLLLLALKMSPRLLLLVRKALPSRPMLRILLPLLRRRMPLGTMALTPSLLLPQSSTRPRGPSRIGCNSFVAQTSRLTISRPLVFATPWPRRPWNLLPRVLPLPSLPSVPSLSPVW